MATDGFLHTYHRGDVDWQGIWSEANQRGDRIPPFGTHPYWIRGGEPKPLSTLAFMGAADRLRIAQDPLAVTEQSLMGLMAGDLMLTGRPNPAMGDPDPSVFQAASRAYRGVRA